MKLTKRKADIKKDSDLLLQIAGKCFNRPFDTHSQSDKDFLEMLKDSQIYLYFQIEEPIGYFAYSSRKEDRVDLDIITLCPKYQGKGIGKKMMDEFLILTKRKDIYTFTHPKNSAAIGLYLKKGFEIYDWKDDYLKDGEPRIFLRRLGKKAS